MKIKIPKCCGECVMCKQIDGMSICTFNSVPSYMDIRSVSVDTKKMPDWCELKKMNNGIEQLPDDKKDAVNMLVKGLSILLHAEGFIEDE